MNCGVSVCHLSLVFIGRKYLRRRIQRHIIWPFGTGSRLYRLVVKSGTAPDLTSFPCVDLESPLMLDFFINSTIFDPFAMNAYISFLVSNPGKTHKYSALTRSKMITKVKLQRY